uniref:Uncharacterized protein n=1 Tax=Anguilla anguilla TaxID=7936 RepID=A0A0E9QW91_ANGAN
MMTTQLVANCGLGVIPEKAKRISMMPLLSQQSQIV